MGSWFSFDSPFMNALNKIMNLFVLNICFLLCCIPVVTIGAGMTALYSVNLKMARDEEPPVWKGFWKAFRENFRQGTICFLILLGLGLLLFQNYRILPQLSGIPAIVSGALVISATAIYAMEFLYVFPYIARFENRLGVCMMNAVLIGISRIGYTLALLFITAAVSLLLLSNMEFLLRSLIVWLLLGFSLMNYIFSKLLRRVFDRYS